MLDVSDALKNPGVPVPFDLDEVLEPQMIFGETITFDRVRLLGNSVFEENNLRIQGDLTTKAHGRCAACGNPVTLDLKVPFDEIYVRLTRQMKIHQSEESEIFGEEQLVFEGSKVELHHLVLTLILLELPIRFECFPMCGEMAQARSGVKSMNACQKELPDQHPFSALQQLLTKDEEV